MDIDTAVLLIQVVLSVTVITWALWRRDIFLYLIAGPVAIGMGLAWRGHNPEFDGYIVAGAFIGIGVYCLIMGIWNLVDKASSRR